MLHIDNKVFVIVQCRVMPRSEPISQFFTQCVRCYCCATTAICNLLTPLLTLLTVPFSVADVRLVNVTQTSATIAWEEPAHLLGIEKNYNVTLEKDIGHLIFTEVITTTNVFEVNHSIHSLVITVHVLCVWCVLASSIQYIHVL